jgi:hypothetical protein
MEGVLLKPPTTLDVRVGFAGGDWERGAKEIANAVAEIGRAHAEFAAADWIGRDVTIGARVIGPNGKESAWALYNLHVVRPLDAPAGLKTEPTAQGVRVSWGGGPGTFRVLRRSGGDREFSTVAEVEAREWTDSNAEFGKSYAYRVQRIEKQAESDLSSEAEITPRDVFPPAVPAGLNASPAPASIELTWERNTEPDLAGYRLYRAEGAGEYERIAEVSQVPAYSDQKVERGKTYRYEVSAIDRSGNESARSAQVEASIP